MRFIQHRLVRATIRTSALAVSLSIVALLWTMTTAQAGIAPDINAKNWYWGPGNHWSYQHTNRIFPSADIARGSGPVSPLTYALRDLDEVSFVNSTTKQKMTVAQMYAATDTDALLVMKDGKIVTERYFNGMKPEDRHLLMSVSNSFGVGEAPRRSTSSLEANLDTGSALVYRIHYEQFGDHCFS